MKVKGKEFLQKLAEQDLFISRDGQQLAVGLAKGTLVVAPWISATLCRSLHQGRLTHKAPAAPSKKGWVKVTGSAQWQ